MSSNLSAKLDELQQRGDRQLETNVALCEIRTQLQELTKSVESCQSEVSEVKRDMVAIKVLPDLDIDSRPILTKLRCDGRRTCKKKHRFKEINV